MQGSRQSWLYALCVRQPSTGHESFVRWGPLIKADIRDHATLREVMLSYDVVGTLSLLRAMLETNTPTVVFSSSCAIYGEPSRFR